MKRQFDRKALQRFFQSDDMVLVLLPIPGSSMYACFFGPYSIERRLSDTDYVVDYVSPDRRRKTRVCHINMLKRYHPRGDMQPERRSANPAAAVGAAVLAAVSSSPSTLTVSDEDGLNGHKVQQKTPRLSNPEILLNLPSLMPHLSKEQEADMVGLIHNFPCLF